MLIISSDQSLCNPFQSALCYIVLAYIIYFRILILFFPMPSLQGCRSNVWIGSSTSLKSFQIEDFYFIRLKYDYINSKTFVQIVLTRYPHSDLYQKISEKNCFQDHKRTQIILISKFWLFRILCSLIRGLENNMSNSFSYF